MSGGFENIRKISAENDMAGIVCSSLRAERSETIFNNTTSSFSRHIRIFAITKACVYKTFKRLKCHLFPRGQPNCSLNVSWLLVNNRLSSIKSRKK